MIFKYSFIFLFLTTPLFAASLEKKDVLTWPRSNPKDFGCFLEKTFKHRDSKFNCDLKTYDNKGDPCKNTKSYYEGPQFPKIHASQVHPLIKSIGLEWEHGSLREVNLTLTKILTEKEVRKELNLPADLKKDNIMGLSVQECSKTATCVVIQGFDHQGAADVGCGG